MSQETQQQIILYFVACYVFSSFTGAILFSVIWRLTHIDRIALRENHASDGRVSRLRHSAAWRNEYVAGVMASAFILYACAATIGVIRVTGIIHIPWEKGLVTTFLLVAGNALEMTVAVALVFARRQMNREDGPARP